MKTSEEYENEIAKLKNDKLHLEILAEGRLQHNKKLEADNERLKEQRKDCEKYLEYVADELLEKYPMIAGGIYNFLTKYKAQILP